MGVLHARHQQNKRTLAEVTNVLWAQQRPLFAPPKHLACHLQIKLQHQTAASTIDYRKSIPASLIQAIYAHRLLATQIS